MVIPPKVKYNLINGPTILLLILYLCVFEINNIHLKTLHESLEHQYS